MVKQYQETAHFLFGVRDIKELQNMAEMASVMSSPQKFCVQRALVLTVEEYRFYTEKSFREPFFGIHQQGPCPEFDVQTKTWNCVLVVSETGKDGVLVSKEPDADRYYMAYVPEHSKLDLRRTCLWISGPVSVPRTCSCSRQMAIAPRRPNRRIGSSTLPHLWGWCCRPCGANCILRPMTSRRTG